MSKFDDRSAVKRYQTEVKMNTNSTGDRNTTERWFVLALSLWGAAVFVAGYYGAFTKIDTILVPPLVMVGITIPVLVYYLNKNFKSYIWSIDVKHFTIFHVWRIVAALVFFHYGSQNLLPKQFVIDAGYGDLAVGLLVPVVLILRGDNSKYLAFHIFGLLDFVVAVGTGFTFNVILHDPLMGNITRFPIVLIPLYGVPVTGALTIMTLDRLLRRQFDHEATGQFGYQANRS